MILYHYKVMIAQHTDSNSGTVFALRTIFRISKWESLSPLTFCNRSSVVLHVLDIVADPRNGVLFDKFAAERGVEFLFNEFRNSK